MMYNFNNIIIKLVVLRNHGAMLLAQIPERAWDKHEVCDKNMFFLLPKTCENKVKINTKNNIKMKKKPIKY